MVVNNLLPPGQYVEGKPIYEQVAIHFTAGGSAGSSIAGWKSTEERVGTPVLVERNGDRVNALDPEKGWLWHLGGEQHIHIPYNKTRKPGQPPLSMSAEAMNKRSLGIEIANLGPLTLKGDTLHSWVGPFCKLSDTLKYVKTRKWRGFEYWERYTPAQLATLKSVVAEFCAKYSIPMKILPGYLRDEVCPVEASNFKGIVCHHNYLWKFDAGIQLDMEWLIAR